MSRRVLRKPPKPRRDPGATLSPQRRYVRYAGRRWRIVRDAGRWVFIERGTSTLYGLWVPAGCLA